MATWQSTCVLLVSSLSMVLVAGQTETIVEAYTGRSVILPCTIKPQGDLSWRKGLQVILVKPTKGRVIYASSLWNGSVSLVGDSDLEIRSLRRGRDTGTAFSCSYSGGETSQKIQIRLLERIREVRIPEANNGQVTLTEGSRLNLQCYVFGDATTPIYYDWEVDGTLVKGLGFLNQVIFRTTKSVRCIASNRYNNGTELSSQDVTVTLNVLYLNKATGTDVINVTESNRATLSCPAEGNPPPSIQWIRSSKIYSNSFRYTIERANRTDAGLYTCRANNSVGSKNLTVRLDVFYPPDVQVFSLLRFDGQFLICQADGVPTIYEFSPWEHRLGGTLLRTLGTRSTVSPVNLLLPGTLTFEDMGYYVCQVTNGIKSPQRAQVFVYVQTPAVFQKSTVLKIREGGTKTLSVSFFTYSVTPNVNVMWNKSGETTAFTSHSEVTGPVTLEIRGQNVSIFGTVTVLTLVNISGSDSGNYTVTVSNDINGVTVENEMTVQVQVIANDQNDNGVNVGAIGGSIAAIIAGVVIVTAIVWKRRKIGLKCCKMSSSPLEQNASPRNEVYRMTENDSTKVYDNLEISPDYVNTTEDKMYASLDQNKTAGQTGGVKPIESVSHDEIIPQYEEMPSDNSPKPIPDYIDLSSNTETSDYVNSVCDS